MLQGEHSAILSTFFKLPFVIKIFVLSFFLSGRFTQVLLYDSEKPFNLRLTFRMYSQPLNPTHLCLRCCNGGRDSAISSMVRHVVGTVLFRADEWVYFYTLIYVKPSFTNDVCQWLQNCSLRPSHT